MVEDTELLRRYIEDGTEGAFTELVRRHVNLVYGAALRRVGFDRQLAEEVTQTVFTQCARKAAGLRHHPVLGGWLHRSTRFAAIDARRAKQRREKIEEIESMDSRIAVRLEDESGWEEIRPAIDGLLDRLAERDRDAVVLRFFEGCSFAQIGGKLGLSEDAARMRVDRALGKLRAALARAGCNSSGAALAETLAEHAVVAAPGGLAATVSSGALAAASAAGGGWFAGAALLTMNKINAGILGALVVAGIAAVGVEWRANRALADEATGLRREAWALAEAVRTPPPAPVAARDPAATSRVADELARWRARLGELKSRPDGVVDAEIKPRAEWRNAGYATPAAAIETFVWAATNGKFDVLAESFVFGDKTKEQADAFFAALSPQLRAKYGSAERLFAPYLTATPVKRAVDAMQVIEVRDGDRPDEAVVRYWVHFADGAGHEDTLPFRRVGDEWRMGSHAMGLSVPTAAEWIHSHVDPAVGPIAGAGN